MPKVDPRDEIDTVRHDADADILAHPQPLGFLPTLRFWHKPAIKRSTHWVRAPPFIVSLVAVAASPPAWAWVTFATVLVASAIVLGALERKVRTGLKAMRERTARALTDTPP